MSEVNNRDKLAGNQEEKSSPEQITRRSLLIGLGLLAFGASAGGVITRELFPVYRDYRRRGELTDDEYRRLAEAEAPARKQAEELQTRINATVETKTPIEVFVLNDIFVNERVGDRYWRIDRPILLGNPPKKNDLDTGFWFGMQYSNPGGKGQPPSVGVQAVLYDPARMGLSWYRVPKGDRPLEAQRMQILVMSPDPNIPADNTVAYAYNEYVPDHRQRRSDDPTQLVAPGRQVPIG